MSQTLSRGLDALKALADGPQSIGEVADRLGVHHSTALRLLHTLEAERFVTRVDGRYRLGPVLAWLGQSMLDQVDLRAVARRHIEELAAAVGETVHLASLIDREVYYVDKVESSHPVRMYSHVGKSAPMHCTGVAKAIASRSERLRDRLRELPQPYERFTANTRTTYEELQVDFDAAETDGYVLDDQEHEASIHCIAVPVLGADGEAHSAVSVAVPVHRCDLATLRSFAPRLQATATAISRELGYARVR